MFTEKEPAPGEGLNVAPQVFVAIGGVATISPGGRMSIKLTPVRVPVGLCAFKLLI